MLESEEAQSQRSVFIKVETKELHYVRSPGKSYGERRVQLCCTCMLLSERLKLCRMVSQLGRCSIVWTLLEFEMLKVCTLSLQTWLVACHGISVDKEFMQKNLT